ESGANIIKGNDEVMIRPEAVDPDSVRIITSSLPLIILAPDSPIFFVTAHTRQVYDLKKDGKDFYLNFDNST
ncbi:hypothetical protein ACC44_02365, partial [Francisella tularensis subsp. holarctica]